MNAITLIKRDHRAVEEAYEDYKKAESHSEKERLAAEICESLRAHADMEEQYFYPVIEEQSRKDEKLIDEADHEHEEIKSLAAAARWLSPGIQMDEAMGKLMGAVFHHVQEEESELLPQAQIDLGEEKMQELGRVMEPYSPSAKKTEKKTAARGPAARKARKKMAKSHA